jgi:ribosomal protein S18 acetylase RimI-like enzyme
MEIEQIKDPTVEVFDKVVGLLNTVFEKFPGHVEHTSQEILERVSRSRDPMILMANLENRLAGFAICYEGRLTGFYHIRELAVDEDFRGRGIATRLYEEIERFAVEKSYKGVTLNTFNKFKASLRLAIKRGYEIYDLDKTLPYEDDPKIKLRLTLVEE